MHYQRTHFVTASTWKVRQVSLRRHEAKQGPTIPMFTLNSDSTHLMRQKAERSSATLYSYGWVVKWKMEVGIQAAWQRSNCQIFTAAQTYKQCTKCLCFFLQDAVAYTRSAHPAGDHGAELICLCKGELVIGSRCLRIPERYLQVLALNRIQMIT